MRFLVRGSRNIPFFFFLSRFTIFLRNKNKYESRPHRGAKIERKKDNTLRTRWREEVKSVKGADKASRVKVSRKFPFANIFGRQTLENNLESNFHSRFSIALTNPNVLTKSSSQKEKRKKKREAF